jgi:hypothetical protein
LWGDHPTNIAVRCTYKYFGALQIFRCATNIAVRYKYCGALHLDACLVCTAATNIAVRCTLTPPRVHGGYKYCGAMHLDTCLVCTAATKISVRYKYFGALHLNASSGAWRLQILRCAAP